MIIIQLHGYNGQMRQAFSDSIKKVLESTSVLLESVFLETFNGSVVDMSGCPTKYIRIIHDGSVESLDVLAKITHLTASHCIVEVAKTS